MTVRDAIADWLRAAADGWNRFWFTPRQPQTLGLIRILAGTMLLYSHIVWSLDLMAFVGPDGWVKPEVSRELFARTTAWSLLWHIRSPAALWAVHIAGALVLVGLVVGWHSRVMAVLAWLLTVSYCHRASQATFGLDQITSMLAMYLMVGPCGAAYSIDRWLRARRDATQESPRPSIGANVATRLIQVHLCVIYLFSALGKTRGQMWWDGSAVWYAVANYEYQSLDVTWLVHFPWLVALLSHVTLFWELFYCVLVWPRWTRPVMLSLAVAVHGGIALCLGMATFGIAMIIANLAFISPEQVQRWIDGAGSRLRRMRHTVEADSS